MNKWIYSLLAVLLVWTGCKPKETANDKTRAAQESLVSEAVAQVGQPAIKNFRELKLVSNLYELRDQEGLTTYTYLWSEVSAKYVFFCHSIGYGIPYAAQISAPESMQTYRIVKKTSEGGDNYGVSRLPQPEPNGLFIPESAEGTWVICKDPNGPDVKPVYLEPRVIVSPFPMTNEPSKENKPAQ